MFFIKLSISFKSKKGLSEHTLIKEVKPKLFAQDINRFNTSNSAPLKQKSFLDCQNCSITSSLVLFVVAITTFKPQ